MAAADAMAAILVQPPISSPHLALPIPRIHRTSSRFTYPRKNNKNGSRHSPSGIITMKLSDQSSGVIGDEQTVTEIPKDSGLAIAQIKPKLYEALQGINRGIFGVPSEKKHEIESLIEKLESQNPTPDPTLDLQKVDGCWKLLYSTVTILGSKRTKLGLRDFITLGDFFQTIHMSESKAVNVIKFNVRGLNLLNGKLTIESSFKITSNSRVSINYENSTITPDQFMNVFKKNYHLLLEIFNPEGSLDISYVDDTMRIGRDDKGNIFILERSGWDYLV